MLYAIQQRENVTILYTTLQNSSSQIVVCGLISTGL